MSATDTSKHLGGADALPSTSSGPELEQNNVYQDGDLGTVESSPYLGFDFDADGDENFDFDEDGQLIADLPDDNHTLEDSHLHDKRKDFGDQSTDGGGGKRREGEPKIPKKPGRKPLTAEPVTKRKAQNRAAQRAFRERKEKLLKDLKEKVDDLEKTSESTNQENGALRAKVQRLEIELKEYQKRLATTNAQGLPVVASAAPATAARNSMGLNDNFRFDFPRFGGPPVVSPPRSQTGNTNTSASTTPVRASTLPAKPGAFGIPGVVQRNDRSSFGSVASSTAQPMFGSVTNSPANTAEASPDTRNLQFSNRDSSVDSFRGLFSPSVLEASRQSSTYPPPTGPQNGIGSRRQIDQTAKLLNARNSSGSSLSNINSPASSYESHNNTTSSLDTSPEPILNSPAQQQLDSGLGTISEEYSQQGNLGGIGIGFTPNTELDDFSFFAQQNGGKFDPVLFDDYRESQDSIASQDLGRYIDEWFPLPDLGSPGLTFDGASTNPPKSDLISEVDAVQSGQDEVTLGDDGSQLMSCNKIWDRLQGMEQSSNGSIEMDNLCNDLLMKARCGDKGTGVVHEKDFEQAVQSASKDKSLTNE